MDRQRLHPEVEEVVQELVAPMLTRIDRLVAIIEEQQRQLYAQRNQSPWISAEDAAALLGINVTPSKHHVRKLTKHIQAGQLVKINDGKPRLYYRTEVQQLAEKIAVGKAIPF